MKRFITVLLVLMLMLTVLTACGKDNASAKELDLEEVYQSIIDAQENTDDIALWPEASSEIIDSFYPGLSSVELKQQVLYMHPVTGAPCEIFLVEVANSDDVNTVRDIFNARIELGSDDEFYPDNAAGWKNNAQVQTDGNYVAMVVLPDGCTVPENVFAQ